MEDKLKNFKPLSELLDSVRNIDGFPIGEDKDILALSDAPYYTACPNPYINDFIEAYGTPYDEATDTYERKPFVGDVAEGKNDPIYNAHMYHTKVPPKAIKYYLEHYTEINDVVLDGFSGSGMTGVAAQSLGRKAILSDLSPVASFITYNYNKSINYEEFELKASQILKELEEEYGWMYETNHFLEEKSQQLSLDSKTKDKGIINYMVWSDVLICPYCKNEYIFYETAVDKETNKVLSDYDCPSCRAKINKRSSQKKLKEFYDSALKVNPKMIEQIPVLINYTYNGKKFNKKLDLNDFEILKKIEEKEIPNWYPSNRMPLGDESRRNDKVGITHIHHFYTKRNLWLLAALREKCDNNSLLLWFNSQLINISKLNRYRPGVSFPYNPMSGTLYISSQVSEANIFTAYQNKISKLKAAFKQVKSGSIVSTNSVTEMLLKNNSIDYIFTDPPFGSNLMYSELNFIWESWLKIKTNNKEEAIINKNQEKDLKDYKKLMIAAFKEYYRVLKPNRWITVEFHNSKAAVWNTIQESITKAGFIIAQVAVLDKIQGSFKQVTSAGAVSKDLVINAYKPKTEFKERFLKSAGEGMEIEFVKQQLNHLPIEPNVERTEQMLYSKMLAHYIENGFKIKYNSQNFFELLENNFVELDGYWFDESEVLRYNEWKSKQGNLDKIKELKNAGMILFINNEKTALQWIYQFLNEPRSYSDILTNYNMIVDSKSKDEIPELREMLDNNFFTEEGEYRRPYTKDERNQLKKHREKELEKAWEKILERAKNEKNKMKTVRKEALEYGFKKCYDEENYQDIILVGKKLHDSILEENSDITEFIEIAEIKLDI